MIEIIEGFPDNVVGISSYHLFEADRAIALYFVLRKQAVHESGSPLSSIKPRAAAGE